MAGIRLSRRESEVARLVADGLTNKQIAERLFIAERTAEGHVEQIRNKLGFNTRSQIAAWVAGGSQGIDARLGTSRLPSPLTSLVGRTGEIKEVADLLRTTPLVTIAGPGGIGKTRLALEVGRTLEAHFVGGVWFVELASVSNERSPAVEVSLSLGLTQGSADPAEAQIARYLAVRNALLILDNCEHIVQACAELVTYLLTRAGHTRILCTGREPLGVDGERIWRLGPLSIERSSGAPGEAVQLLTERCRDLGAEDVTSTNVAHAIAICERLDGLPLAIELAAAQTEVLSLAEIAKRLDDSKLLASSTRTVSPRHQTLLAAIDWSYQLLSSEERAALRRLSVFRSGFDLEAASWVIQVSGDQPSTVALVGALIRKSVLGVRSRSSNHRRYQMLETVRAFGRDRLEEAGETTSVRARHATFYLQLAEAAFSGLRGADSEMWVSRLDLERDNLATAIETLSATDDGEFIRMVSALGRYWIRGRLRDGYAPTERAVRLARARGRPNLDLLEAWAWLTWQADQLELAVGAAEEMFSEATDRLDDAHAGRALNAAAMFRTGGGLDVSLDYWRRSEDLLRKAGDDWALALLLNDVGFIRILGGEARPGLRRINEALRLAHQAGDGWLVALITDSAAWAHADLGEVDAARRLWSGGLEKIARATDRWILPNFLEGFARVARLEHQPERASVLFGAAEAVRAEIGARAPENWNDYLQPDLEGLKTELGMAAFENRWAEGLQMSADAAIEYARERT